MTLIEVAVALPIVLVGIGLFLQMLTAGSGLRRTGQEFWIASSAAQDTLEEMRNADYRDLFRLYNADPFDDPGGPGTAPGASFTVPGFEPLPDDPDGVVGEVVLPAVNTGTEVAPVWELREDIANDPLGTPRDLTGDAVVGDVDVSADYTVLPILIRLRWDGDHGPRELRIHSILSEVR